MVKKKMGTFKTNGIIIGESNMGDYDKMLTMLTPRSSVKYHVLLKEQEEQKVLFLLVVSCYALENICYIKELVHIV